MHQWCSGAGGGEHAHGEIKPDGHHSGLLDLAQKSPVPQARSMTTEPPGAESFFIEALRQRTSRPNDMMRFTRS